MTLKTQLAADAFSVFLNTDEFAEQVTYKPKVGSPRSIKVLVERRQREQDPTGVRTRGALVRVLNHATNGVSLPTTSDLVTLALDAGQAARECRVVRYEPDSDEFWLLEVVA